MADTRVHFELSRWSTAAAVFGGACNLLFWIVEFYRDDSLSNHWGGLIFPIAITLAPSLVLFAFRNSLPVVVIYASVLFWILVWRIRYPHEYYVGQKYDNPGVILVFLGIISAAIVLVRATIFLVMFIWRVLKSNRASRGA